MQKIFTFAQIGEAAACMDNKVLGYISGWQSESFESHETFDLLAFDYYDIRSERTASSKILIYMDKENLFFFCRDQAAELCVDNIVQELTGNGPINNEQLFYAFFVKLLQGNMDYLNRFETQINDEEAKILSGRQRDAIVQICNWRKELLRLKRYYEQLDSIFDEMDANDNKLLSGQFIKRIAILGARTDRYLNAVRNLQEIVNQMREEYQSQLSIQQNDLMRVFTIVTVLFLPLTLIAGWYGMNFTDMPELHWEFGYPAVIIASVVIITALILFFRRKKWF